MKLVACRVGPYVTETETTKANEDNLAEVIPFPTPVVMDSFPEALAA